MENKTGWKSPKRKANIIVGTEQSPTEFNGGEVIINKKATKKNLDRLIEINNDGSGKVTTDASDGGILKGKPHYDKNGDPTGGIPGVVAGSKNIETEGGEFVVNPEASEKHWKELSEINQSTGGVPINNPNGFDDDPQEYSEGGKIKFNANKLPKSSILNYAEMVRTKYPKVWDLGGNIFGNEAFKNLKRVSDRGYWTDNEEWMYIKWRSYVARHQKDFRIAGVIAMLKWVDTVDRGWAYMRKLIDEEIKKRYPKKMKEGGSIPKTKETYEVVVKISNISNPNEINGSGVKNKYKGAYKQIFNILNQDSILIEVESVDEILVGNDLYVFFENQFEADKYDKISKLKNVEIFETKFKLGGRTIAQTPAPKKDRVEGSKVNQVESSESLSKASSIKFSSKTLSSIKGKVEEHNESHPDKKITLASAKAVVRRGMGAYSSSHRPTIGGGKPNDRTAWGLARLDAFTYKIVHGKSKSGKYTQDDDLINELGYSVSKYHLGGDMTKHLAPNGKPSNLKTKAFVVFFKSNLLNNIIYTNIDSDSLENAVKEQQSLYSWSDIAWIKGFEQKSANDLQEFFLQNIKEKWETKPELSVSIKNGKIFFKRNKDSVSFYFIPVFEVKDGVRIFKEGYLQHSTTEIYIDSAFNFDRNKIFELMLKRMADGGNIEYQSRNLSGSMVYYRRKGNEKWEFISKDEFDKNANEMNTVIFKDGGPVDEFPNQIKGNDDITWVKNKQSKDLVNYTPYYRGYNIDIGGYNFRTLKEAESFISNYILSNQLYKKLRYEPVKELPKMKDGGPVDGKIEMVSVDYLNSIRTQSKSNWNYDLEKSIEQEGVKEPVIIGFWAESGDVALLDGHNRLDTAIELGIDKIPAIVDQRYDNPKGKVKLSETPIYNENPKKPSDLGIFKDGGPVDAKDTVTVDIPLIIRLLELSREDIKSDAELHMVVERLLNLKNKPVLTMDDYAYIAEIEHKHLKKMELGGNIENEKLISQAHTNLTVKKGRRDYAPTTIEIQEEIDRMIIEGQFGSSNV